MSKLKPLAKANGNVVKANDNVVKANGNVVKANDNVVKAKTMRVLILPASKNKVLWLKSMTIQILNVAYLERYEEMWLKPLLFTEYKQAEIHHKLWLKSHLI